MLPLIGLERFQKLRFRVTKVDGSVGVAAGTIFIDKIVVVPVKDTTAPTLSAVSMASDNATQYSSWNW